MQAILDTVVAVATFAVLATPGLVAAIYVAVDSCLEHGTIDR
jgi:hypothetical protein